MSSNDNDKKNLIFKDEEKLVLDHDYDGIQELDHNLPNWWLGILYGTIVFSVAYSIYYLGGYGLTQSEELNRDMAAIEAMRPAQTAGGDDTAVILASLKDPSKLKLGNAVYAGKCAACHGDKGQGLIGPNLTDDHWLHGDGSPAKVAAVVRDGVAEKGMPPWGPVLSSDDVVNVTAFIRSLHGTNPSGAKEPQGNPQQWQNL